MSFGSALLSLELSFALSLTSIGFGFDIKSPDFFHLPFFVETVDLSSISNYLVGGR